jgi:glucose-6-phosphate 1-dehydrogenase
MLGQFKRRLSNLRPKGDSPSDAPPPPSAAAKPPRRLMSRPFTSRKASGMELHPDEHHNSCEYLQVGLTIFVIGASGDLAKKKTYPSLFALYLSGYLPEHAIIVGYARSEKTDESFRAHLDSFLKVQPDDALLLEKKQQFLTKCIYRHGKYDSADDVGAVSREMEALEEASGFKVHNRLFYFAIPPTVFVPIGTSIKAAALTTRGWNRLIVEKPFGHDLASFDQLSQDMGALYSEDEIYRIDHYLGKEMVQNLLLLRFANTIFEPMWNRNYISSVTITFKEDIGTEGRGGYFDSFGIIRDVMQNHLLQVLSLIAMEPPVLASGPDYSNYVRDEKVKVLNCIQPIELSETVIGQYVGSAEHKEPGYLEDPTVPKGSVTPTFATCILRVNNARWDGVPFIMKAGKALNERKGEIRVQFRPPPGASHMFPDVEIPLQELVMRLQPDEAVYMKVNVKSPGLATQAISSELDLSYAQRYAGTEVPDAYTRLILDVLRGKQAAFVRDDELRAAWKIFTPLLNEIEGKKIKPLPYKFGSRGPKESDELTTRVGFAYHRGRYQWSSPKHANSNL